MNTSEVIAELQESLAKKGDLPIEVWDGIDWAPLREICANSNGTTVQFHN